MAALVMNGEEIANSKVAGFWVSKEAAGHFALFYAGWVLCQGQGS